MKPNDHIAAMAPYALAEFAVPEGVQMVSLAQNESLRPPTPTAFLAAQDVLQRSADYPDPDYPALRAAIAQVHDIPAEQILVGAGSMELITCIAQAYAHPQAPVLTTEFGYALFRNSAEKLAAPTILASEPGKKVCVDALLAALTPDVNLCFVANPGNPSGTHVPNGELRRLRAALPDHVLLVVDEAYGEFAPASEPPLFDLVDGGNTIILRTFSKAYGLAAARVGWGLFPPAIADEVRKLIIPSSISETSAAMAVAAMQDQVYMRETCELTIQLRTAFVEKISRHGLICVDSHTNFVLLEFADAAQVRAVDHALRLSGYVARGMGGYGLGHCLRITIAQQEHMQKVADILIKWAEENLT